MSGPTLPSIESIVTDPTLHDWQEDFSHENGYYQNECATCKKMFYGHKRRGICKACAMTAPTREQVAAWEAEAAAYANSDKAATEHQEWGMAYASRLVELALAFAAGARSSAPAALPQALLDFDDFLNEPPSDEGERRVREYRHEAYRKWRPVLDAIASMSGARSGEDARPCTCHPDDNPPKPCPKKYALSKCKAAGEDARDAARWRKHMEAMRDEMSCLLIRMFEGTAEDYEAAIDAAMGGNDA